jgi:hypothetical protein
VEPVAETLTPAIETDSYPLIKALVARGMACAIVPLKVSTSATCLLHCELVIPYHRNARVVEDPDIREVVAF